MKKIKNVNYFLKFLSNFRKSLEERPDLWENITLEDFLEAMEAFIKDTENFQIKVKNNKDYFKNIDWNIFINILEGAKVYE